MARAPWQISLPETATRRRVGSKIFVEEIADDTDAAVEMEAGDGNRYKRKRRAVIMMTSQNRSKDPETSYYVFVSSSLKSCRSYVGENSRRRRRRRRISVRERLQGVGLLRRDLILELLSTKFEDIVFTFGKLPKENATTDQSSRRHRYARPHRSTLWVERGEIIIKVCKCFLCKS